MKFNQESLNKFAGGLNLISGICGDIVSKFYVDCTLAITAKAEELNKAYNELPANIAYHELLNRKIEERMKIKDKDGVLKNYQTAKQESENILSSSDEYKAFAEEKAEFIKKEFTIDLPNISIKDLGNVTGSQRLAIHELIK